MKTQSNEIAEFCENLAFFLIEKNKKYGDSAINPKKIFSKQNASNSIAIRIDDKINRILNSDVLRENDIIDLLGYLVLYYISKYVYFYALIISTKEKILMTMIKIKLKSKYEKNLQKSDLILSFSVTKINKTYLQKLFNTLISIGIDMKINKKTFEKYLE